MSWKETDPLAIWKSSTLVPTAARKNEDLLTKTSVGKRLAGTRSELWTSLSELTPESREKYLNKLVQNWPFKWEYRALHYPLHAMVISTAITTTYAANRINADILLSNSKASLMESFKKCSKIPIAFGVYMFGVPTFAFANMMVYKPLILNEDPPNPMQVYRRMLAFSVGFGVVVPLLALPHLVYQIKIRTEPKVYQAKNFVDSFVLSYEFSRSIWRKIPHLLAVQVAVGALCAYSMLWARERIFNTMDADPELIRDCVAKSLEDDGFLANAYRNLKHGVTRKFEGPFEMKRD